LFKEAKFQGSNGKVSSYTPAHADPFSPFGEITNIPLHDLPSDCYKLALANILSSTVLKLCSTSSHILPLAVDFRIPGGIPNGCPDQRIGDVKPVVCAFEENLLPKVAVKGSAVSGQQRLLWRAYNTPAFLLLLTLPISLLSVYVHQLNQALTHPSDTISCSKTNSLISKVSNRVHKHRISIYLSPEIPAESLTHMAQQATGNLPQYYGERMQDGTVVESPRTISTGNGSRDALLRLPIQPNTAHLDGEISPISPVMSPVVPMAPSATPGRSRSKMAESGRWVAHPVDERGDDYYRQSRRHNRYGQGSISHRSAYVEDYSDEEDHPRAYRRPARQHARPPPAHGRLPAPVGRYSIEPGRSSLDSHRPSIDYESDTPKKARFYYTYGSEDDDPRHPRLSHGGGGGQKGPPRAPSTDEVMRLPWTMWMNSNAKNRRFYTRPYPKLLPKYRISPDPVCFSPTPALDGQFPSLQLPVQLQRQTLIIS